jgi:hypothetical protein
MKSKAEIMQNRRGGLIPDLSYLAENGFKKCKICKDTLPLDNYVLSRKTLDGLETRCRECNKKRIREIRDRTPGYNTKHSQAFKQRHPQKRAAHLAVARALRAKVLVKQPCSICGETKSESHHEDYSKPLDVLWFCRKHHAEHHEKKRKGLA